MPIYEYRCDKCDHVFEVWCKPSDPDPKSCPACHGRRIRKLMSNNSFVLKGSGWYLTDYARKHIPSETKPAAEKGSPPSAAGSPAAAPSAPAAKPAPASGHKDT